MKYHFIVNENARSGRGRVIWNSMKHQVDKMGIDKEVHFTKYRGHGIKMVRGITSDEEECTIVAIGGDGTVNEVVNGIVNFEKVTLAYIPAGSGNDFARGLGLTTDPIAALDVIVNKKPIKMLDLGEMKRAGRVRKFAISTGAGLDAAVVHRVAISKWKDFFNRIKLGKLIYVAIAVERLINDSTIKIEVTLDDNEPLVFENTYFAAMMNSPYEGGGFMFCPKAKFDDGYLDVIVASNMSKLKVFLVALPRSFKGKHVTVPGVHIFRCKKVKFATEKPVVLHLDGEALFLRNEVTGRVLPGILRTIVG
jgi:YegS/Rv2252/BmrU family lipid kinase